MTALRVGLSTCPNDTFLFHGLLTDAVDRRGLELEFVLGDVQELNEQLHAGALDVGKASFATALQLADRYGVLRVGSALGFGVGPVLLAAPGADVGAGASGSSASADAAQSLRPDARVLCPGEGTTATLLLRALHPELTTIRQVRFDQIMPALAAGEADLGVCIHEGRFTYAEAGLRLVEDLGRVWEDTTEQPVPLGGLLARLDLGDDVHARLVAVLGESLALSRSDPAAALPTMQRWAQELDDDVLWKHVELYVNDHTTDLGEVGARCLEELARRAGAPASLTVL